MIDEAAILEVVDVEKIDEYLDCQARNWWPPTSAQIAADFSVELKPDALGSRASSQDT